MAIELNRKPTEEEVEQICTAAEEAAKDELFRKVSIKQISELDVTVEAVGDKPLVIDVNVEVELLFDDKNIQLLVDTATAAAFSAAEMKVKELNLCVATPA